MLLVQIKKVLIFELFRKNKYVAGKNLFTEIFELIQKKSNISLKYDDILKKKIISFSKTMRVSWNQVKRSKFKLHKYLSECDDKYSIFQVQPIQEISNMVQLDIPTFFQPTQEISNMVQPDIPAFFQPTQEISNMVQPRHWHLKKSRF